MEVGLVTSRPGRFTPALVPIELQVGWALDLFWAFWRRKKKSVAPTRLAWSV